MATMMMMFEEGWSVVPSWSSFNLAGDDEGINPFMHSSIHPFIHSSIHASMYSFIQSRSFSFIHPLMHSSI